jgi:cell division protein FtsB
VKTTYSKQKVKVKIHRTSDYDDKHTGIRDFPNEKAMLDYGLSKVNEVVIKKYTKDDEFMAAARKTRGEKFDYDMELND